MVQGEPRRADAGLRRFGEQIGDATMCQRCYGSGVVLTELWSQGRIIEQPKKCPDCRGEGLDPDVQHGGV
jgi:DnaJ-class molecular chaperone